MYINWIILKYFVIIITYIQTCYFYRFQIHVCCTMWEIWSKTPKLLFHLWTDNHTVMCMKPCLYHRWAEWEVLARRTHAVSMDYCTHSSSDEASLKTTWLHRWNGLLYLLYIKSTGCFVLAIVLSETIITRVRRTGFEIAAILR